MMLYGKVFSSYGKLYNITNFTFVYFFRRTFSGIPFIDLYEKTTGQKLSHNVLPKLKKKHPHIDTVSHEGLQNTLQILAKFGITQLDACQNPHLFSMNPITVDNYGEILKECCFTKITPKHIMRYHTLVKSKTIDELKKQGLIGNDIVLEEALNNCFEEWPSNYKVLQKFEDKTTSILSVRMSVLEKYLHWRLSVTSEEFQKYCRLYLPLKHKPMCDILQALHLAQNVIKFDVNTIRRNGFIISTDPIKTQLILENVDTLAGLDIKDAIRAEPGILKNNHIAILETRRLLEEYEISIEAQRTYLRIFCMSPKTVQQRLDELKQLKEYQIMASNPRVLWLVVHKTKVMSRLAKIEQAKKQCYSLNNLVSAEKIFANYISSFGNKICGRDIAILITSTLCQNEPYSKRTNSETIKAVMNKLKRHKYWLHCALRVVDENIRLLKSKFNNEIVVNHCQLLLYPASEIEYYLEHLLKLRDGEIKISDDRNILDPIYNTLKHSELTDGQILSLVLYEIEKKYHFSGDGIWATQEANRAEAKT